jgi:hypothetical protein
MITCEYLSLRRARFDHGFNIIILIPSSSSTTNKWQHPMLIHPLSRLIGSNTPDGKWAAPCHFADVSRGGDVRESWRQGCGSCCVIGSILNYTGGSS